MLCYPSLERKKIPPVSFFANRLFKKEDLLRLIDQHSFLLWYCGMSLNMDVTSFGNVSKEFRDMFAKMIRHVCSIDVRTKDLVLDLMKAIA
jgi:hypothetical protein